MGTFNLLKPVWGPFLFSPHLFGLGTNPHVGVGVGAGQSEAFLFFFLFAVEEEGDPYRQEIWSGRREWKEKRDGKWTERRRGGSGTNLKCSVFI